MQSERNAATEQCQRLHAAGAEVVSTAQSEFRAAGEQYEAVREQARRLNTDLAESKRQCGDTEAEVERIRLVLSEANASMSKESAMLTKAAKQRDENVIALVASDAKLSALEFAAERAQHAELAQVSHFKRLQDEYTSALSASVRSDAGQASKEDYKIAILESKIK